MFLLKVLDRDIAEQSTRALDLKAVGEHADLDVAAPYVGAVISMGDRVGNRLSQCLPMKTAAS